MLGTLLVYAGVSLYMLDSYGPLYGASASSATMLTQYSRSFAFPMFALRMFQALGPGWATSLLAFLTLLLAPVPWCFWIFSKRLRRKSRYEIS
jgi:MFS transporter, DHA1 family, multidrug resistance protein